MTVFSGHLPGAGIKGLHADGRVQYIRQAPGFSLQQYTCRGHRASM